LHPPTHGASPREKQEYFLHLLESVQIEVMRYIQAITRNDQVTRDVFSETLVIAYERMDSIKKPESFKFFLISIARHVLKRSWQKKRLFVRMDPGCEELLWDTTQAADSMYDITLLYTVLNKLPSMQKEALILYELQGFSLKEIRELQGGSISSVKMRLVRGRKLLNKLLRDPIPQRVNVANECDTNNDCTSNGRTDA